MKMLLVGSKRKIVYVAEGNRNQEIPLIQQTLAECLLHNAEHWDSIATQTQF